MVYGFIICAGRQSRFKSETPKALVNINGKTLLQINQDAISGFCDKIFVVCSVENEAFFNCKNKIVIESGKGSGDAVWQALETIKINSGDTGFIIWGDSLQSSKVASFLKKNYKGKTIIPCVYEKSPYVQIKQKSKDSVMINFSKFGDSITAGYHDLSIFYCDLSELILKLREFGNRIKDAKGNYIHKHGNEMEFLDVFNETDIKVELLEFKQHKDFSFNTVEQLNQLIETYSAVQI